MNTPLDKKQLLIEFGNDKEFVEKIVHDFCTIVEKKISNIEKALLKEDLKTIEKEAHAIRGGASNLTADQLAKAASDLEAAAGISDIKKISQLVDKVSTEFTRLCDYYFNDIESFTG